MSTSSTTTPEQTETGRIDWQPGWYAICDDCGWLAGPCATEADAHAAADAHDLAMGEVTPEGRRPEGDGSLNPPPPGNGAAFGWGVP